MKCRTSYFNRTVLKKDILRYAPLWALYLIGALLVAFTTVKLTASTTLATTLGEAIGPLCILSMLYAFCAAQLLFGDLFNARLCYALHAMPLRREGWFFTHIVAGVLYCVVPNGVICLLLLPFLGQFWYAALLWLLGMTLSYLFFFGLAVVCMMLSGNRLAATAIYALLNLLSPIALWFCVTIYQPLLYGIVIQDDVFALLCPVWLLAASEPFFSVEHSLSCRCMSNGGVPYTWDVANHTFEFSGLSESWLPLSILAVIGVGLLFAALLLYRRRNMEAAGDFIAVRAVKPVFSVLYTLCVGAVVQMVGALFDDGQYIFMTIGLIVGYFTGQMLLERTLHVFRGRNWLSLGIILVVLLCSFGLCRIDVFGVVHRIPDKNDVVSVKLADTYTTHFTDRNTDAELTDYEDIERILLAHYIILKEGDPEDDYYSQGYTRLTICYTLRNGREVYRQYRVAVGKKAERIINSILYCDPTVLLKADSLAELKANVTAVKVDGISFGGGTEATRALLEALWLDCVEGTFSPNDHYANEDNDYCAYITIVPRSGDAINLDIYLKNVHTAAWLRDYSLLALPYEYLLEQVFCVMFNEQVLYKGGEDGYLIEKCLSLFQLEENAQGIFRYAPTNQNYIGVHLVFEDGEAINYYVAENAGSLYEFLLNPTDW